MEKMLTVADIANILGVPTSRVYDCWRRWGLPMYRIGQQLRCDPGEFKQWRNARRIARPDAS